MNANRTPIYKQTEVGAIPEDWDVKPLGQLVHAVEYGSSAKSSPAGKVPVLRMGNIQEGQIDWSDLVFTDDDNEIAKYLASPGDVFFNRTNTVDLVGKTAIYKGEQPAIFAGYLIRIKEKKDLLDSRYLNYFLNSEPAKNYGFKVLSVAVGQANINGQKLKTYPIPLPPSISEQHAIATAISDTEELISGLDQLIAKKHDIQQATIQQLITGQNRLPGFSQKWEVSCLSDVIEKFVGGGTPSRHIPEYWGGNIPWVTVKDFATFNPWTSQESITHVGLKSSASSLVPAGTLITSTRMALGKAVLYNVDVAINQDLKALFVKPSITANFLYYWFKFKEKFIDNLGSGSTVKGLSLIDLRLISLVLPPIDEQQAIVATLSVMDAELAILEARRAKTREFKQGMIQQLLTGKIRLIDKAVI